MGSTVSVPAPLRLRPLEIGDLLDETFRMYRRHFLLFAGISVIVSIPAAALSGFSYYAVLGGLLQRTATGQPDIAAVQRTLLGVGIGAVVNVALLPFYYGAVTFAACQSALVRRYLSLLGYWVLIWLMLVVFCLIPLWVWIWVGWVVVMPVMFIENVGLTSAMGRSWRLVQGRWWRTFLIIFLLLILFSIVRAALGAFIALGLGLLQIVISSVVVLWISAAVGVIIDALVNPVLQIAVVLIYFDLRVRREALDLFQLA
jgi:hypothetical protein